MLDRDVQRLAYRILKALDSPRSLGIKLLMDAGDWDQLPSLWVDPANYEPVYHRGIENYRRDVLANEFLRKLESLPTGIDTADVARRSFLETERQCARTNLYLDRFMDNPVFETAMDSALYDKMSVAKRWIARTLGDLPEFLNGRFGPGATFESDEWRSATRKGLTAYTKLRHTPTRTSGISEDLADHLVWSTGFSHAWEECCPNRLIPYTRGNRFDTVPKDSSKDRGIAIEPGVNVLGQLAVGGEMRIRLKRRGIDLKTGQDLHRQMAKSASQHGDYVTIDLSNASNTVTTALVKILLPELWYDLLSSLRSPFIRFSPSGKRRDMRWQRLEMFSSMGNGYTFELETLIFASLIHSCGGKIGQDSFVYGDDIIVPREIADDLLAILQCVGFTPNKKKTFTHGSFRESCGGDFLLGHDVRPFYIKEDPDEPTDWMGIANNLWDWSHKWDLPELLGARAQCIDSIPAPLRCLRGPKALGNLTLWDHPDKWSCRVRNSVRWFRVWRPVFRKQYLRLVRGSLMLVPSGTKPGATNRVGVFEERGVALAAACLNMRSDGLVPRGDKGLLGYRFGRLSYS